MEADIVLKNGLILTMDEGFNFHEKADLAIKDSKIIDISPQTKYKGKKTIEARGKLLMPGLINCHTHAAMAMMRGLADDMAFETWWHDFIFPIEKRLLDPDFIRVGAGLAAIEMIKSGTTTFNDMYFFEDVAAETCRQVGIRSYLGETVMSAETPDKKTPDEALKLIEEMKEKWRDDPIVHLTVAPHAPYSCDEAALKKSKQLSDRLDLPLHIHIAETAGEVEAFKATHGGSTPVEYLASTGFLSEKVIAVHCVHLSRHDIELLKKHDVKVAHCQESNMKLAVGSAPIVEIQNEGIVVGLGTDGAASNNNLDMFDEMDSAAKFHKATHADPTVMPAKTVVKMATRDGARLLGRSDLGSLAIGQTADVIIVGLNRPHLVPLYNIYSNLVYSAGGGDVDTAIINGKLIMENRKMLTVDEGEIIDRANHLAKKIEREVKHA
ncbi:MAG: amidohydrolase [Candidatus Margulisbacteria bacterium]|nr:amidohydrolase [Candidatus Margulisiibacteriota bacterium]